LAYPIPADGSYYIDIAKDLSAVNRRLYRQGMQYYIRDVSFVFAPTTTVGSIVMGVFTAGDTWCVHNAWKKGFALWRSQQRDVDAVLPHLQGKWADFKIELWDGATAAIDTVASDGAAIIPDEWNLSNFVWDDDGDERGPSFCLVGATDARTKIGLVQEYHISRAQTGDASGEPLVSAEASDSIFAKSLGTDEMSDLLVDIVEGDNDLPPYNADEMIGGDTEGDVPVIAAHAIANANVGISHTGSFTAECGLMRIDFGTFAADGSPGDLSNLVTDPKLVMYIDVAP
jgi:hypothetical protein